MICIKQQYVDRANVLATKKGHLYVAHIYIKALPPSPVRYTNRDMAVRTEEQPDAARLPNLAAARRRRPPLAVAVRRSPSAVRR